MYVCIPTYMYTSLGRIITGALNGSAPPAANPRLEALALKGRSVQTTLSRVNARPAVAG